MNHELTERGHDGIFANYAFIVVVLFVILAIILGTLWMY